MDVDSNKTLSQTSLSLPFFPNLETITLSLKLHSHFLTSSSPVGLCKCPVEQLHFGGVDWLVDCELCSQGTSTHKSSGRAHLGKQLILFGLPQEDKDSRSLVLPRPSSSLPSTAPCIITQGSPVRSHRAFLQIPALSSRTCWNVHCSFGGDKPAALLFSMAPRSWSCYGSLELWPLAHGLHGPIGLQPCK